MTIGAKGITAKVYLDGVELGYAPRVKHKAAVGKHTIKIVEEIDGQPGRTKEVEIELAVEHTTDAPLKTIIGM